MHCRKRFTSRPLATIAALASVLVGIASAPTPSKSESSFFQPLDQGRMPIAQIHRLHGRKSKKELEGIDRYLSAIERSTRRIGLLVAASVGDKRTESRLENLNLLKAEFSKWQQIRGEIEEFDRRQVEARKSRSIERQIKQLAQLETAIRREILNARQIAQTENDAERQILGRRQLHRIRGQRTDSRNSSRSPMLTVIVSDDQTSAETTASSDNSGVQYVQGMDATKNLREESDRTLSRGSHESWILLPFQEENAEVETGDKGVDYGSPSSDVRGGGRRK